jgi:hypothetical protein
VAEPPAVVPGSRREVVTVGKGRGTDADKEVFGPGDRSMSEIGELSVD